MEPERNVIPMPMQENTRTQSSSSPAMASVSPINRAASNAPNAADDASGGSVDKIRDILFGAQMREYDRRFTRLEDRLRRFLAVADLLRVIAVPIHTDTHFRDQSWGKDMVVVDRATVRTLDAGAREAASAYSIGAAVNPVHRRGHCYRA